MHLAKVPITSADLILTGAAAVLVAVLALQAWSGEVAAYAEVTTPAGTQVVALDAARLVPVAGALGPTVLEVAPGQLRVRSAPCRGQQCVHAGWLRRAGAATACLPGRVSVRVHGDGALDAVSY